MLLESAFASEPGDRRNVIIIVSHTRGGMVTCDRQFNICMCASCSEPHPPSVTARACASALSKRGVSGL